MLWLNNHTVKSWSRCSFVMLCNDYFSTFPLLQYLIILFFRSKKSKHCANCNKCISDFDHHCLWLNNCIGGQNYRYTIQIKLSYSICFMLTISDITSYKCCNMPQIVPFLTFLPKSFLRVLKKREKNQPYFKNSWTFYGTSYIEHLLNCFLIGQLTSAINTERIRGQNDSFGREYLN